MMMMVFIKVQCRFVYNKIVVKSIHPSIRCMKHTIRQTVARGNGAILECTGFTSLQVIVLQPVGIRNQGIMLRFDLSFGYASDTNTDIYAAAAPRISESPASRTAMVEQR